MTLSRQAQDFVDRHTPKEETSQARAAALYAEAERETRLGTKLEQDATAARAAGEQIRARNLSQRAEQAGLRAARLAEQARHLETRQAKRASGRLTSPTDSRQGANCAETPRNTPLVRAMREAHERWQAAAAVEAPPQPNGAAVWQRVHARRGWN